jgi:hypothetical protein
VELRYHIKLHKYFISILRIQTPNYNHFMKKACAPSCNKNMTKQFSLIRHFCRKKLSVSFLQLIYFSSDWRIRSTPANVCSTLTRSWFIRAGSTITENTPDNSDLRGRIRCVREPTGRCSTIWESTGSRRKWNSGKG